jgi:predicted O-linked N-acetylglucosamine transferase (SPINDLY family)
MTRSEAGLPEDAFVLCAFNHSYKVLPETFDAWCTVLREVPHAVLWLRDTGGQMHAQARQAAAERGVDPSRVIFAARVPYEQHFSRLALADVFADTWPYNAHTSASDALWAGVPVVTRYGNSYASRVAASVLNACGLAELAFQTAEQYTQALLALATEPALCRHYRAHLQAQPEALPLFDTPRYAQELGAVLERMARRWQQGLAPAHLLAAGSGA